MLGVEVPLLQAPVGGLTCPDLVAAVSNAGGLGTLSATWRTPAETRDAVVRIKQLTRRPFGVNFVLRWDPAAGIDVCLAAQVPLVWLSWGDPAAFVPRLHAGGSRVAVTIASQREAERALEAGADVLVAQGWEAGGHLQGNVGLMALIPRIVDVAGPVPVVAAGGIADGRGFAAALILGAAGVSMGTRFVASEEAFAHHGYKERLTTAGVDDTVVTTVFDGGWPDEPHRVLGEGTHATWIAAGRPAPGMRPGEGEVLATRQGQTITRYHNDAPTADVSGRFEEMALYAGQGVGLIDAVEPAGAIVRKTWQQVHERLKLGCCFPQS